MKYDFIIFENFYWATNHYKDLAIIAKLLSSSGFSVAIADVFQEVSLCQVPGIPHIRLKTQLDYNIEPSRSKSRFWGNVINVSRKFKIDNYLRTVIREIANMANSFYVGSYHSGISLKWLRELPDNTNVFFWGLRSYRLIEYKVRPFSKVALNSFLLRRYLNTHTNIKFFVSDELIKNDFIEIGIPEERLIIRPERYIVNHRINNGERKTNVLELLSIGSIRPDKRIELILTALNNLKDRDIHYTLAGRISDDYRSVVSKHIDNDTNVETRFGFLSEEIFHCLIQKADFLVLCDVKQYSLVTNGTMNEALLNGIPIIAPNYLPYSYYINKFGVGILFDPDQDGDLERAIKEAKNTGRAAFINNISNYQSQYTFDKICSDFKNEIIAKID